MSVTQNVNVSESPWLGYYENTSKGNTPWDTLSSAVEKFNNEGVLEGTAIDLGSGVGKDTAHLVLNNWQVTAVDAEQISEQYLRRKIPSDKQEQVTFIASKYEDYVFSEKVKLINASYALPFCSPSAFSDVMQRISDAILPGGRFAGHFFGPNDSWSGDSSLTFLNKSEVLHYFSGPFVVELCEEKEWDGMSGSGLKHWHVFNVIAKKV